MLTLAKWFATSFLGKFMSNSFYTACLTVKVRLSSVSALFLLLSMLFLSACGQESIVASHNPTTLSSNPRSTSAVAVTTSPTPILPTATPVVALLPTPTPLPIDFPDNTPVYHTAPTATATPTSAISTLTPSSVPLTHTVTASKSITAPISTKSAGTATPTAVPNLNALNLNSIKTTKVTFLQAYNLASLKVMAVQPAAKLVLAEATYFTTSHTGWIFYFVWPQGSKMYVATYDSALPQVQLNDNQPPIMTQYAGLVNAKKILDTPTVIAKIEATGISGNTLIDSFQFEPYGTPSVPAFIAINASSQKQLVVNAYTGQVLENQFAQ